MLTGVINEAENKEAENKETEKKETPEVVEPQEEEELEKPQMTVWVTLGLLAVVTVVSYLLCTLILFALTPSCSW